MSHQPYHRFSNDPALSNTYMRYRVDNDNRHPTIRYWIWIIPTSIFIILLGWATHFIDRCRGALVFDSLVFKFCLLTFLLAFVCASYVLYKMREFRVNRMQMVRIHLYTSGVLSIVLCVASLILFTIAIYPAFQEASIAFSILATMFLTNLGMLLLHD